MYASVRDHILLYTYPTIREGLDAIGFDAVELEYTHENTVRSIAPKNGEAFTALDSPGAIESYRKHLEEQKVRVSSLLLMNDFGRDDVQDEIRWVSSALKAADALGIKAVRIDAIMHGEEDLPLENRVQIFADAMAQVLDATSNIDVDMGIENHGFQGNQPEFLDMVLNKVNSPRLGLTMDTGNFYWAGYPIDKVYQILEHFAPRTKHTHAKNINYPADLRNTQRELGWEYGTYVSPLPDGDIDHARVVSILKAAGYDRDLCLEDESLVKWKPEEFAAVLKRDAEFFLQILK